MAKGYLKDLVDRNLILVRRWSRNGNIKTCNIHDLVRALCLKVANKEKFLCVMKVLDTPQPINTERRIVLRGWIPKQQEYPEVFHALKSAPLARSLICNGGRLSLDFKLLRVLTAVKRNVDVLTLEPDFQQVNLRYLDCEFHGPYGAFRPSLCLSSSISLLWNLQTLIILHHGHIVAPSEIWEMPQLRHLKVRRALCLPDPPPSDRVNQQDNFIVLRKLQTLMKIKDLKLSEEVCKRIPNIKKLQIWYFDLPSSYYCPHNLGRLHKLESLYCSFAFGENWRDLLWRDLLLQNRTFPSSLKKLSLTYSHLHWEDLTMIGSLPHLEVLKLNWNSVVGPEWNPVEGEFLHLKFLKIVTCGDLIYWNADSSHFPVLEQLVLEQLGKLHEIPLGIGEIPTLRFIRLDECSVSAAISAMKILVEQESLGNEGLQLEVKFRNEKKRQSCRKMVQLDGLTSNNLHLL